MNEQRMTIDFSIIGILKVVGILLGLWFLYLIRDIVLLLFLVIIIVMALDPIVALWQRKMRRSLAVALLVSIIVGGMAIIISLLLPPLINQINELAMNLPNYSQSVSNTIHAPFFENTALTQRILQTISEQLSNLSRGFISTTLGILGGLVTFLTVFVLSVYLLLEEKGIRNFIVSLLPTENREHIYRAVSKIGDKLGAWLRGQLLLMLIIGVATVIWTTSLGLPYVLTLGLWAGLTEVIPFLGPILGGLPILLFAFLDSPLKALIAFALIVVVQQVESNFIVPKVMQRSVGLSPVIVIVALMIGSKLFGITGTILSVPFAAALVVLIQEWPRLITSSSKKSA
jgi:predicted PurR-regulated permease PerM